MPTRSHKKPRPHGPGKRGGDGLTDRQRAFVRERRADPSSPMPEIMRRAGFVGNTTQLSNRASGMMRDPKIRAAVYAPDRSAEAQADDEDGLKQEMRRHLLSIVRGNASAADKIKSIDKVLATIPGGYVPVQVDMRQRLTLENLLTGAGLAPGQVIELPSHDEKEDECETKCAN